MSDEKTTDNSQNITFPVNLRLSSRTPAIYAQLMTVTPSADEVILSFFEVQSPVIQTPEVLEQIKATGLQAECVARIAVAPRRFLEFAQKITEVANSYSVDKVRDEAQE